MANKDEPKNIICTSLLVFLHKDNIYIKEFLKFLLANNLYNTFIYAKDLEKKSISLPIITSFLYPFKILAINSTFNPYGLDTIPTLNNKWHKQLYAYEKQQQSKKRR